MSDSFGQYLSAIEAELISVLTSPEPGIEPLYSMMKYHMGWLDEAFYPADEARGKRLRPILCLSACEAVGGDWRKAVPVAASLELIHNFSLVHDDIEDKSETRRHRRTVWSLWGVPQGINTGDAMWVLSRLAVHRLTGAGHSPATVLAVAKRLEEACLELCRGQYLDLRFEHEDTVSLAEYERMISGKTAALISASLAVGALLGGANARLVSEHGVFGHELGLSFQVTDDILGIWGDPSVTGKSAASDILERKKSLPILHALEWERGRGGQKLAQILARPSLTQADIPRVLDFLRQAASREFCRAEAQRHQAAALEHLDATGCSGPAQDAIRGLALAIADRAY